MEAGGRLSELLANAMEAGGRLSELLANAMEAGGCLPELPANAMEAGGRAIYPLHHHCRSKKKPQSPDQLEPH